MAPQSHAAHRKALHSLRVCKCQPEDGPRNILQRRHCTAQAKFYTRFIHTKLVLSDETKVWTQYSDQQKSTGQMRKGLAESQSPERRKRVLLKSNSPRDLRSKTRRIDRSSQILKKFTLDLSRLSASSRTPLAACSLMSSVSGCGCKCVRRSDEFRVWHRPYQDIRRDNLPRI